MCMCITKKLWKRQVEEKVSKIGWALGYLHILERERDTSVGFPFGVGGRCGNEQLKKSQLVSKIPFMSSR